MPEPQMVKCLECGVMIELDPYVEAGDPVFCEGCETEFMVLALNPPRLGPTDDFEARNRDKDDMTEWYSNEDYESGYDF